MNRLIGFLGLSLMSLSVACGSADVPAGSADTTAIVQGSLVGTSNLNGLRAIAKTDSGRLIWTNVDARGHFALQLPKGQAYRILLARVAANGSSRVIGHLVLKTSQGKSLWVVPTDSLALGRVGRAGQVGGTITVKSTDSEEGESKGDGRGGKSGASESSGEHEDGSCHEEEEKEGSLCKGSSGGEHDEELEAENDPGDKCAKAGHEDDDTDHDGKVDADDDDQDDIKPCGPPASGSDGGAPTGADAAPPPASDPLAPR
ncbi:MAG: hypothetical protein U0174_12230 [Polyangiaceae bacterium]